MPTAERGEEEPFHEGQGRRASLLGGIGAAALTLTPSRGAGAFPSQSLEGLQESAASRSGAGDFGAAALRNPAIYRSRLHWASDLPSNLRPTLVNNSIMYSCLCRSLS